MQVVVWVSWGLSVRFGEVGRGAHHTGDELN